MKRLMLVALFGTAAGAAPIDMALFQQYDYDGDGFVDQVEVQASVDLAGRFNDLDVDRDGRVSAAEMQAWLDRADKGNPLSTAAPIRPHEQWREIQRRREAEEAKRAEDLLNGKEPTDASATSAPVDSGSLSPSAAPATTPSRTSAQP